MISMSPNHRVIVVGAGAAGMVAAIAAARKGASVVAVERMRRVGKKILATGNGRESYQYGLEFVDVTDDEKIGISAYVYEQMLTQHE